MTAIPPFDENNSSEPKQYLQDGQSMPSELLFEKLSNGNIVVKQILQKAYGDKIEHLISRLKNISDSKTDMDSM